MAQGRRHAGCATRPLLPPHSPTVEGFVDGDDLVCGYHGWTYNAAGRCVRIPQNADAAIPAGAKVTAYHCQSKYGYVWVALDEPLRGIPDFPEESSGRHRRILQFYEQWNTSPVRMMENSFDNSHFSFVHKANFGLFNQPQPAGYEFRDTDYGFEAETLVPVRNPPASFRITGTEEPVTHRHLITDTFCRFVGASVVTTLPAALITSSITAPHRSTMNA